MKCKNCGSENIGKPELVSEPDERAVLMRMGRLTGDATYRAPCFECEDFEVVE